MNLELHVAGPGLAVSRRLAVGGPALILGRDTHCAICLPDPERTVSRRHLSVWNAAGQLHFLVLSRVNGIELAGAPLPPGSRGVLLPGDPLMVAGYRLGVTTVADETTVPSTQPVDPWTEFEQEAARLLSAASMPTAAPQEDPFDWDFQSTFGELPASDGAPPDPLQPGTDLSAFFLGLGLPGVQPGSFTQGELETMGRVTRIALQGLLQLQQAAGASRPAGPADDRTGIEPRPANPLRLDTPLESRLGYLFGGQAATADWLPPERAVAEVLTELAAHQQATPEAVRATIAAVLREFNPDTLKARLLAGGPRLFEAGRAWAAFSRHFAARSRDMDGWVRELGDRTFAHAHAEAVRRAKRRSGGGEGGEGG